MKYQRIIAVLLIISALVFASVPAFADDLISDGTGEKYVVCLDAGHGGIDGGTDVGTHTEKEYNLKIALFMRDALLADGRFDVVMTRDDDTYLRYAPRADIARRANADVILSLHCNEVPEDYVSGTQAFVSLIPEYSADDLAALLLDAIESSVGIPRGRILRREDTGDSLGVYYWNSERQWDMPGASEYGQLSDYFSINTFSSKFGIPSIIVEHGYLTNEHDLSVLNDDEKLKTMAEAEAGAIIEFFTNHEHNYIKTVDYPSNCVFAGSVSMRCTVCGAKINTEPLAPIPDAHFWRLTHTDGDGCGHYVCQIEYNLDAKGYDLGHEVTEMTLQSGETVAETPAECQHCYDEIITPATCTESGKVTRRCLLCGEETVEVIASFGHTFEESVVPATCTEDGERTKTCSVCGESVTEVIAASGHVYDEEQSKMPRRRVCEVCGEEEQLPPSERYADAVLICAGVITIVLIVAIVVLLTAKNKKHIKKTAHPLEEAPDGEYDRSKSE